MKETYKVRCPKRIVFGDPQYFEQLKGAKLKSLTVDYKPRSHFTSRVVIEEKPFERFPQRNELTLNIYFAPEDEIETYMENMMYQGQKVTVKNIGIDSPEYCLKIDEQEITMQTDGDGYWGAILAATSGVLAERPGAAELLEEALELYDLRFWNEEEGLSCDTWNTEFTVLDDYRGLNANMHTVEAFLAAADVTGKEEYRVRAGRIIEHVIGWASGNNWRIPEHFTKEWKADLECNRERPDDQFKPYGATPGHGIEWARLITQWALSTYKNDEKQSALFIQVAENLFDRAVEDAWNADGAPGIVYTTDWEGKPVVHDRMHWTLAEAINTSAVLYQVTKKQKYAEEYAEFMHYLDEKVLDHINGSWFHQLDRNNQVIGTVWPGKSDLYHAVQATLIPYYAPDLSIAPAVKRGQKR